MKWQIFIWFFYSLFAFSLGAADMGSRRTSVSNNSPDNGYFFRCYLPSLMDQDGVLNDFHIYKVIPTTNTSFMAKFFYEEPGQFQPYRFLNKADFISFFNPKKPNKTVFRIVMGEDAVVLGRYADILTLKSLVKEPYFEGEIRVQKNGLIKLKALTDPPLHGDNLKKAQSLATYFFNGFTIIVLQAPNI